MRDLYVMKARTCREQAKRERHPDVRAMLRRNARAYSAMAKQEITA